MVLIIVADRAYLVPVFSKTTVGSVHPVCRKYKKEEL